MVSASSSTYSTIASSSASSATSSSATCLHHPAQLQYMSPLVWLKSCISCMFCVLVFVDHIPVPHKSLGLRAMLQSIDMTLL
ncbi:hypothetical protein Plhal304r1_c016g0059171 [Plasmopara halstedii]